MYDFVFNFSKFMNSNEITNYKTNNQNGKISAGIFVLGVKLCVFDAI
jgi:hypothetical protein